MNHSKYKRDFFLIFKIKKKIKNNKYITIKKIITLKDIINHIYKFSFLSFIYNLTQYFILKNIITTKRLILLFYIVIFKEIINNITQSFLESFTKSENIKKKKQKKENTYQSLVKDKITEQRYIIKKYKKKFFIFSISMLLLSLITFHYILPNLMNKILNIITLKQIFNNNNLHLYEYIYIYKYILIFILEIIITIDQYFIKKYGYFSFYFFFIIKNSLIIALKKFNTIENLNRLFKLENLLLFQKIIEYIIFYFYNAQINKIYSKFILNKKHTNIIYFDYKKCLRETFLIIIEKNFTLFTTKIIILNLLKIKNLTQMHDISIIFKNIIILKAIEQKLLNSIKDILKYNIRLIYYINKNIIDKISITSLLIISLKSNLISLLFYNVFFIFTTFHIIKFSKQFSFKISLYILIYLTIISLIKILTHQYYFIDSFLEIKKEFYLIFISKITNYILTIVLYLIYNNKSLKNNNNLYKKILLFFITKNQILSIETYIHLFFFLYSVSIIISGIEKLIILKLMSNYSKYKNNNLLNKIYRKNFFFILTNNLFISIIFYILKQSKNIINILNDIIPITIKDQLFTTQIKIYIIFLIGIISILILLSHIENIFKKFKKHFEI